ncbi:MAG TPA: hypothetical protein VHF45_03945 [Thermoleophilaceae bacterium]|nr:hypothetical protein [Thermoleophilaceae bacterium]
MTQMGEQASKSETRGRESAFSAFAVAAFLLSELACIAFFAVLFL